MRVFSSLRVLVKAITGSIGALVWSMLLLFLIQLSACLLLARIFEPIILDNATNYTTREFLFDKFGSCVRSFITVFEITMAPGGFIPYRKIFFLPDISAFVIIFFIAYVCVVTFAVIRVITAMFLKATLSASSSDNQEQANLTYISLLECVASRRHLEAGGDTDGVNDAEQGDEVVDKEDLFELLELPGMSEWLDDGGLTNKDAKWLFDVQASRNHGTVYLAEYMSALMRIRGTARAADVARQLHEVRHMSQRFDDLEKLILGANVSGETDRAQASGRKGPRWRI